MEIFPEFVIIEAEKRFSIFFWRFHMSIGSTIKRLRRENDMTQEQLAEYLGITSRAISQWECDRTAPDISQLPALCHIFNVSSDVLLGIDIEKTNEAIQEILNQAKTALHEGKYEENAQILRDGNRRFPKSFEIMEKLADAFVCVYSRKGIKEYDDVFSLCHCILNECTDSKIRYRAMETLGTAYGCAGKKDEMLKLAEEMPHSYFSYENFMLYRWEGSADLQKRQKYMSYLIDQLLSMIVCLSGHCDDEGKMIYSREERKKLWKLEIDLLELLYPNGDYQYCAQYGEIVCRFFVSDCLREKDYESIWYWLNKSADFAIHADTYDVHAPHTSLILRGYSDGGWIMEAEGNRSQAMLDWLMSDHDTEILRSDPGFIPLVNRLKAVAKHLKIQ